MSVYQPPIHGVCRGMLPRRVPNAEEGSDDTPPDFATVVADFAAGFYTVGGEAVTLADLVTLSEGVSTSGGLVLTTSDTAQPMAGALAAAILTANWTVIADLVVDNLDAGSSGAYVFEADDGDDDNNDVSLLLTATEDGFVTQADHFGFALEGESWVGDDELVSEPTVRHSGDFVRVALTRKTSGLAISVNGGAVVTNTAPVPLAVPLVRALFGGGSPTSPVLWGFTIQRFEVRLPEDDAALPSLSTPPG